MLTKRLLLLAPTLVSVFLLQSYFWVPTFEDQAKGDPGRLTRYISASIGDASILNPTLSADSASSEVNNLVFEGLIDRDLDLSFRGRLAESWKIFEEAYLLVDESLRLSDGAPAAAKVLLDRLNAAKRSQAQALRLVQTIELLPGETVTEEVRPPTSREQRSQDGSPVRVTIRRPPRLKFTLSEVDQDFFEGLDRLLGGYVKRLDPLKFVTAPDSAVAKSIAEERLPPAEANPVIIFNLRRGARFHDGHEFDSSDVRFTYETITDPRNLSPRVPDFEPVKSVETPDRYTVRVTYKRLFQPGFESWGMGILPEHLLNGEQIRKEAIAAGRDPEKFSVRDSGFNRRPIGTGLFRFAEWKTDQYIKLARFDDYWGGPANFKEYWIRIIPDLLTTEVTFYAGTSDAYAAQPHQVQRLRNDPRFHAVSFLALGYTYIGYNMRRPIFQDVRVRRALGMAINTDEIIRYVLLGHGETTTGPFPKQTDYYDPEIQPLRYDPDGAARLLAEAGWKKNAGGVLEKDGKPLAFTIITNSGNEERNAIMVIAQDAWRRLGIQVQALTLEWAVFINQRVDKGDFDAVVLGWSMGLDADIYQIFHSSQTGHFQLNFVGYKNPRADDLMVRIRQEYNYERQVAMARELHRLIAEDQPYTFLYVGKWTALFDRKITRLVGGPDGTPRYAQIVTTKLGSPKFHFTQWIKVPRPLAGPVPSLQ
jgi:ABC-type transport system substrate-binding protein